MKQLENRPDPTSLQRRADELRSQVTSKDPQSLAWRTGSTFLSNESGKGTFQLPVWKRDTILSFPVLTAVDREKGSPVSPLIETLLLYYFSTADGTPLRGEWISFADLPDGRFYNQAFQGYTGVELSRFFQSDTDRLMHAVLNAGGENAEDIPGDLAFRFSALPRIPLALVYWQGDEDFPSSFQILFDASAPNYLPTDACAILGSNLTGTLKKKA